ncbi:MAG: DNA mismatch repair protein MutS, partial [Gammaproteobacteria bacterium]
AKLAGLPREVLAEARRVLVGLESAQANGGGNGPQGTLDLAAPITTAIGGVNGAAPGAPDPQTEALIAALRDLDPDTLSPRDALGKVYDLKKLLR